MFPTRASDGHSVLECFCFIRASRNCTSCCSPLAAHPPDPLPPPLSPFFIMCFKILNQKRSCRPLPSPTPTRCQCHRHFVVFPLLCPPACPCALPLSPRLRSFSPHLYPGSTHAKSLTPSAAANRSVSFPCAPHPHAHPCIRPRHSHIPSRPYVLHACLAETWSQSAPSSKNLYTVLLPRKHFFEGCLCLTSSTPSDHRAPVWCTTRQNNRTKRFTISLQWYNKIQ